MKKITLHSAAVRNDGGYVDAGNSLDIGDGSTQIDADRAKALVESGRAVSETEAKRIEKAAETGADPVDEPAQK